MNVSINITSSNLDTFKSTFSNVMSFFKNTTSMSDINISVNVFDYSGNEEIINHIQNFPFNNEADISVNRHSFRNDELSNHKLNIIKTLASKYDAFVEINSSVKFTGDCGDFIEPLEYLSDENIGSIFFDYFDENDNLVFLKSMPITNGVIPMVVMSLKKYAETYANEKENTELALISKYVSVHVPLPVCKMEKR